MSEPATPTTRLVERRGQPVRLVRGCVMEVLRGPDEGKRIELTQPRIVIGSHAANELVLRDATVSRHHLEVTATAEGYRLLDLGSSNGSFAGGLRLGEAYVAAAVVLQLGQTVLRLSTGSLEAEVPASTANAFGPLVGRSLPMRELFAQLERVAASDCSVLIEGETGVGKERVAEALHAASPAAGGPFIVVDCAALAPALMEAELFGHTRGAFTGAVCDRRGLLEMADGGTLFLDEIGELPLALQVKLLGVLERKRVTPIGSHEARPVRARVIAATHRNLLRQVNEGQFRGDLYYRLAVVRVRVPALRERLDDLPLLVEACLKQLRPREGTRVPAQLSAVALAHLYAQAWPGNVRELFNSVEQAVLQLPASPSPAASPAVPPYFTTREQALDDFNRTYFSSLVARSTNVSLLAREAGLDRRYLLRILDRYGLGRSRRPR